jgi:ketosteroid isomerase-like protein
MSEESTTPDLVQLGRRAIEASNHGDIDPLVDLYAPDAVYVTEGLGQFQGRAAIRGFIEDFRGSFDDFVFEVEQVLDLGKGVVFARQVLNGRLRGGGGVVSMPSGYVLTFVDGLIVRCASYKDPEEARAAAERLAEKRG